MKNVALLVLLSVGVCQQLPAGVIDIGQILLKSNTPSAGNQTLEVFNFTGDCTLYTVCNGINITDWTLTVDYANVGTGAHTATFGPNSTDPIGPLAGFSGTVAGQWTFDESCTVGPSCPPFDTVITSATFSGSLSSTNLILSDGSTFFASPTFTLTYTPTVAFDYAPNFPSYNAAEIMVDGPTDAGTTGTPEPSTLSLVLIGASLACVSRLARRRNTQKISTIESISVVTKV